MGFETERAAIEGRHQANWVATPTEFENVPFSQPVGTAWVRLTILNGDTDRASLGETHLERTLGLIVTQIFVPAGSGTNMARQYADQIAVIWRDKQFSGITCMTPKIAVIGTAGGRTVAENSGWFQVNVTVPYKRDEIITA